eukprot:1949164-Pyramimonas_sp.AAC.1
MDMLSHVSMFIYYANFGRVSGVLSASLPLLAQEGPLNEKGPPESWTSKLHKQLAASDEARNRQFWVQGPVMSPYCRSIYHDK